MFHVVSDNYAIRFCPLRSNHGMKFKGWPTKGSIAALSHPSEGWYEKGQHMTSTQMHEASWAFSNNVKSRQVYGLGVFSKKAASPRGWSNNPENSSNQPLGNFEAGH
jgi:hypothetical protein